MIFSLSERPIATGKYNLPPSVKYFPACSISGIITSVPSLPPVGMSSGYHPKDRAGPSAIPETSPIITSLFNPEGIGSNKFPL